MLSPVQEAIQVECNALATMLIGKNRKYGNSALEPIRIFSKADTAEQIRVRLDDKLSRITRGQPGDDEDVTLDLLGYLILLRVHQRLAATALLNDLCAIRDNCEDKSISAAAAAIVEKGTPTDTFGNDPCVPAGALADDLMNIMQVIQTKGKVTPKANTPLGAEALKMVNALLDRPL